MPIVQLLTVFVLLFVTCAPALADDKPAGLFYAIGGIRGESKEIEIGTIAVSKDGRSWEYVFKGGWVKDHFTHGNDNLIRGITYGKGKFVAAGNKGVGMMVSEDGRNWRHATEFGDGLNAFNVCFGNSLFVAARAADLMRSQDGLEWTKHRTLPVEKVWGDDGVGHMREVVFGNGVFVCIGDRRIGVTKDGKSYTWHRKLEGDNIPKRQTVLFGNGRFLWLKTNGHMHSVDGMNWQPVTIGGNDAKLVENQVYGACWTGDTFLVAGMGKMWSSPDGQTWTEVEKRDRWASPRAAGNGVLLGRDWISKDGGKTWDRVQFEVPTREVVFLPRKSSE